jgi:predicted amidohydrolase YtcJ
VVYEDIFELRKRLIPQRDEAQKRALLGPFIAHLRAHGITAVHCNDPVEDFRLVEAHLSAAATSERVRVLHNFVFDTPQALREQRALYRQGLVGWLCPGGAKLILDGSLGSLSAAVSRPYRDAGEHPRGIVNYSEEELGDWLAAIREVGTHAVLHCIGDRAVALAIDGLRRLSWPAGTLHRLEHVQLLSDAIVAGGFAGLALSVQPSHMWGDREIVARRVDPALARRWAYAYRTMQHAGGLVVFGSDAPVEPIDPWPGIAGAVTRLADDSTPPWIAEEALSLGEAIAAHTTHPARLHGHGFASGQIAVGHKADLVVFEEDPFARLARDPTSLRRGPAVSLTLLDGEPVEGTV